MMRGGRQNPVQRIGRWLVALCLLPVCLGAAIALSRVVLASGNAVSFWILCGTGAACWLIIFFSLPRPLWLYVVGHELTHALWTWLFGGRVRSLRVSSKGGQVRVTKINFLIVLAPYFFPFYAVLWSVLCLAMRSLTGWIWIESVFHLGLGMAYAFHVTLTLHILQTRQSDLEFEGWLFSAVIIVLGNVLVPLIAMPLLTGSVSVATALRWIMEGVGELFSWLGRV
jgi:hypothetical protein